VIPIVLSLLPAAIGVALSPAAIIELILVLFSKRARLNGVVFVATLLVTTFIVAAIGAFAVNVATDDSTDQPSTVKGIVLVVVGLLVFALAARNWQRRHDTSVPKVFDSIGNMGPGAVFVLAFGVVPMNPKNLVIVLAAGAQAGASGEATGTIVAALAIFTILAASPFLAAIGYLLVGGERANTGLEAAREWLIAHNRLIMAVVLGVLGLVLVGQGLAAILS
jgi:hypothetical protein